MISLDLLVSLEEVSSDLLMLPTQKAVGPDGISNIFLKEFAPELAPLIEDIYNQSLREGFVPDTLKQSIITPVPKVCPPEDIFKIRFESSCTHELSGKSIGRVHN